MFSENASCSVSIRYIKITGNLRVVYIRPKLKEYSRTIIGVIAPVHTTGGCFLFSLTINAGL